MSANITYGKNEAEKQAMQDDALSENDDVSDSDEEMKEEESRKEYIFLIDRSYSMHYRIKLARLALILFIQSLPDGSQFNVCSYGSSHQFMFEERSVEYNDENMRTAIEQIKTFEADLGGTEIFTPLSAIFSK